MKTLLTFALSITVLFAEVPALTSFLSSAQEAGATSSTEHFTFSYIPAGKFTMGSPESETGRGSDENQAEVTLTKPFLMCVTEVTQGHWKHVMGTTIAELIESKKDPLGRGAKLRKEPSATGPEQPMCFVSYEDAIEFCAKLTKMLQESGELGENSIVTLPTEAQWEYAARAGTSNIFTTGDMFTDKEGNFLATIPYGTEVKGNYIKATTPAKSYAPNAWGVYDMNGNLYEWCLDWYTETILGGADPAEMTTGDSRNTRGGAWNRRATSCRNAYRYSYDPTQRGNNIGFRVIIANQ